MRQPDVLYPNIEDAMSELERTRRVDNSDEIGDSRQDDSDNNGVKQDDSRASSDSQRDAGSRSPRSAADELDDASRQLRADGYGEVF
ncbi:MAG: hypothetical protein ABI969_06125 [bacterium]